MSVSNSTSVNSSHFLRSSTSFWPLFRAFVSNVYAALDAGRLFIDAVQQNLMLQRTATASPA